MAFVARYWRINHMSLGSTLGEQGQTSSANLTVAELYFYANSADTTPISATYLFESGWISTGNLNNGDNTTVTYNSDSGSGKWIGIDAGSTTTVEKVRITASDTSFFYEAPIRWLLEWSGDGVSWWPAENVVVETTAWTQNESRDYLVDPTSFVSEGANIIAQRAYVVSELSVTDPLVVSAQRAYVVSEPSATDPLVVSAQRAYVVTVLPETGTLATPANAQAPDYIVENSTPYIKFESNTNNKQLWFYPETVGTYEIIALRPNLLDFYESTQTFSGPDQLEVPHFNQVFLTNRTLDAAERTQIKDAMQSGATGTGIDIEFYNSSSVSLSITNPDAETGDTTGWITSGGFTVDGFSGETPSAYQGSHSFYGGPSTAASSAYQDIDVSAYSSGINSGNAGLTVNWQQSHYNGLDQGNIKLEFYSGVSLVGSNAGPGLFAQTGGWFPRTTGEVAVPASTDTIRIIMETQRFSGSNNNAYFDALEGTLVLKTPSSNSVVGGLQDPYISGVLGNPQ